MSDCIESTNHRVKGGYAQIGYGGKTWVHHRLVWTLEHGEIPEGMMVLHRCDNPPCINIDHLFLGTHQDNMDDRRRKGRYPWPSTEGHWSKRDPEAFKAHIERLAARRRKAS